jgi:hypothetical protein
MTKAQAVKHWMDERLALRVCRFVGYSVQETKNGRMGKFQLQCPEGQYAVVLKSGKQSTVPDKVDFVLDEIVVAVGCFGWVLRGDFGPQGSATSIEHLTENKS